MSNREYGPEDGKIGEELLSLSGLYSASSRWRGASRPEP